MIPPRHQHLWCVVLLVLVVYCHLSSASPCNGAKNSSDYGGNLLFDVNCSSGVLSLSNKVAGVEFESVTVVSQCNGTGIVNQQPTIPVNKYDGVGKSDNTFGVGDLPLTEPGGCVLTACFYVDDPDTRGEEYELYLADHKQACMSPGSEICDGAKNSSDYGSNLLFDVNCSSGTFSLSNQQVDVEIIWVRVVSRCNGTGIVNQQPTIPVDGYDGVGKSNRTFTVDDLPLTKPGECVLTACFYVYDPDTPTEFNNLYLADHKPTCTFGLDSLTSTISTIQSTMYLTPEESFKTVSTIILSSSSQILPPAGGILSSDDQTILLASTIPMATMLVVILLVFILALFICIRRGLRVKNTLADFKLEEDKIIALYRFGSVVTVTQPLDPKSQSVPECSTSSYSLAHSMSPRSQDVDAESYLSQATTDVASNKNHSEMRYNAILNSLQTAQPLDLKSQSYAVSEYSISSYSSDPSSAHIMSPRSQDIETDSSQATAGVASNNNHSEMTQNLQTARTPQHMNDYLPNELYEVTFVAELTDSS